DARTLEWATTSPPPGYNFESTPLVHSVDDWWHQKYTEDERGRLVKLTEEERARIRAEDASHNGHGGHSVHLPSPSFYPMIAAFGLPILAYGIIYGRGGGGAYLVSIIGGVITVGALYGWGFEPSVEP